jgi:aspartyl-tRNA(Asn)/glutamyl-tRNA(Gln) amidotransferase subunit C
VANGITEETIRHVARLARIRLADDEVPALREQFATILAYFDKLEELDTSRVEPLARAVELHSVMADDEPGACLTTEQALAAAPDRDGSFFKVPKVLGDT